MNCLVGFLNLNSATADPNLIEQEQIVNEIVKTLPPPLLPPSPEFYSKRNEADVHPSQFASSLLWLDNISLFSNLFAATHQEDQKGFKEAISVWEAQISKEISQHSKSGKLKDTLKSLKESIDSTPYDYATMATHYHSVVNLLYGNNHPFTKATQLYNSKSKEKPNAKKETYRELKSTYLKQFNFTDSTEDTPYDKYITSYISQTTKTRPLYAVGNQAVALDKQINECTKTDRSECVKESRPTQKKLNSKSQEPQLKAKSPETVQTEDENKKSIEFEKSLKLKLIDNKIATSFVAWRMKNLANKRKRDDQNFTRALSDEDNTVKIKELENNHKISKLENDIEENELEKHELTNNLIKNELEKQNDIKNSTFYRKHDPKIYDLKKERLNNAIKQNARKNEKLEIDFKKALEETTLTEFEKKEHSNNLRDLKMYLENFTTPLRQKEASLGDSDKFNKTLIKYKVKKDEPDIMSLEYLLSARHVRIMQDHAQTFLSRYKKSKLHAGNNKIILNRLAKITSDLIDSIGDSSDYIQVADHFQQKIDLTANKFETKIPPTSDEINKKFKTLFNTKNTKRILKKYDEFNHILKYYKFFLDDFPELKLLPQVGHEIKTFVTYAKSPETVQTEGKSLKLKLIDNKIATSFVAWRKKALSDKRAREEQRYKSAFSNENNPVKKNEIEKNHTISELENDIEQNELERHELKNSLNKSELEKYELENNLIENEFEKQNAVKNSTFYRKHDPKAYDLKEVELNNAIKQNDLKQRDLDTTIKQNVIKNEKLEIALKEAIEQSTLKELEKEQHSNNVKKIKTYLGNFTAPLSQENSSPEDSGEINKALTKYKEEGSTDIVTFEYLLSARRVRVINDYSKTFLSWYKESKLYVNNNKSTLDRLAKTINDLINSIGDSSDYIQIANGLQQKIDLKAANLKNKGISLSSPTIQRKIETLFSIKNKKGVLESYADLDHILESNPFVLEDFPELKSLLQVGQEMKTFVKDKNKAIETEKSAAALRKKAAEKEKILKKKLEKQDKAH